MIPVASFSDFSEKISNNYVQIVDIDDFSLRRHAGNLDEIVDSGEKYIEKCQAWRELRESKLFKLLNNFTKFKDYVESKNKTEAEVYFLIRVADLVDFIEKNDEEIPANLSICAKFSILRNVSGLKKKCQIDELHHLQLKVWKYYLYWIEKCLENGGLPDGKKNKKNGSSFGLFVRIYSENEFQSDLRDDGTIDENDELANENETSIDDLFLAVETIEDFYVSHKKLPHEIIKRLEKICGLMSGGISND